MALCPECALIMATPVHSSHILVTLAIELQMEQALLTVESPVNTGKYGGRGWI